MGGGILANPFGDVYLWLGIAAILASVAQPLPLLYHPATPEHEPIQP